ncbi:putative membrane protein [Clostridium bornimense]|uniref:Putative membrane protein n=1 Tax=Clostridium bornimense TaxID=1216932 RepID=W6RWK5_9CLOT|nr:hypothetical protein [Clostridium bornimense]CDM68014.1 putative membrane protein [Clostridium bornimense]
MIFRKKNKTYYVGERKKDKRIREIPIGLLIVLIFIAIYASAKGSECLLNEMFKDKFHDSIYVNVYGAVIDCIIYSICVILIGNQFINYDKVEWLNDPLRKFHKRKRYLEVIGKIIIVIMVIWQMLLICFNVSDMWEDNYKSVNINISKCKIYSSKFSTRSTTEYYIDISKDLSIELNSTQYYELDKLKEKYPEANINIKYLETTELFLTYEKLDSK